jgi:hypothetical protein
LQPAAEESSESEAAVDTQTRRVRQRSEESLVSAGAAADENSDEVEQLARKLVRYAVSCEYSRNPIRRSDVVPKILNGAKPRQFQAVFQEAQLMLRDVFGMELTAVPKEEKVTIRQRRGAQSFCYIYAQTHVLSSGSERRKDIYKAGYLVSDKYPSR